MLEKHLNPFLFEDFSRNKNILHFISTRIGGFSNSPYSSLNLGLNVGDNSAEVIKNRELLASSLNIPTNSFTFAKQVHKGNVSVIKNEMKGRGAINYREGIDATDAMITDVPGICLVVLVADCVPVLFFDTIKKVIGVAHAGWRGTVGLVVKNTVRLLQEEFNSILEDIIVGIGPSIGPCCFEVGSDVKEEVENVFHTKDRYIINRDDKEYFDLWENNKQQLIQVGVLEQNIEVAGVCTYCHSDRFFSVRRQNGNTGRFGAGIMIM